MVRIAGLESANGRVSSLLMSAHYFARLLVSTHAIASIYRPLVCFHGQSTAVNCLGIFGDTF